MVAVRIAEPHEVRLVERYKTEQDAEALVNFAVIRRGVTTEFYTTVPSGAFKDGDLWSDVTTTGV